ncbi:glutamate--tRNA ligase [Patescibacteria group bacterium]|nr:glutamate--tRNA ligase [Patescibacteria group bacterium]MBU1016232.1 glutamate--tRNA ligase [Patescibacteria group bacterium]
MIRVRIPPSPTGLLHIGTVRTALYNYLFAKHGDADGPGTMVFRIENTDKERSTKEFEEGIINGLVKLGIAGDEGVHIPGSKGYRQSERTEFYEKYLKQLLDEDKAYFCGCTKERLEEMRNEQQAKKLPPRYDGTCAGKKLTEGVIRLRVPADRGDIKWNDLVRGETVIHARELDDFVIARAIDDPLYHLTVVADDHDMKITHVIRGEDHISNTPKQILLFEAFGWEVPEFAHLPLILNEDKSKLSKRKNKVSVDDYLAEGYLPEALLNFLALLGWNTPDEQEIFMMDELIEKFTLDRVHKGGAVFDVKKLDWVNGEYIKKMITEDVDGFYEMAKVFIVGNVPTEDEVLIKKILRDPDFEGRFKKLSEIPGGLAPLFTKLPDYPLELIAREKFQITPDILRKVLEKAIEVTDHLEWKKGDGSKSQMISDAFVCIVSELGLKNGQVLWPVRVALSGLEKSPNFATLAVYLGKEEVLKRLKTALKKVS